MDKPMLGIITPMEDEFRLLFDGITNPVQYQYSEILLVSGVLGGMPVVIAKSGMGKVNAALAAQIMIDRFNIERLVMLGVGGVLNSELNIGDVVVSQDVLYHDFDAVGMGFKPAEIPYFGKSIFNADKALIESALYASTEALSKLQGKYPAMLKLNECQPKAVLGRILTGDQFIAGVEKKEQLIASFGGDCVEMEGAAVAHTAYVNGKQFVIVRALSDECGSDAEIDFYEYLKTIAPHLLFEIAVCMIDRLRNE
ncbi:MAG: 5'-methylthioadenosine/adenosylhomocysteine nucleosidase [Dehalococcoidales bacterium]